MGDGGDAPEAPDYSEVIGMLKDTFKISNERAKELWDWGVQAYKTNSGVGRLAITNALGQMDKLAQAADEYRAEYKTYGPARAKQLADAIKMGTPGYQEEQAKKATQNVAAKVKQAREAALQRLEGLGIAKSALSVGDLATRVAEAGMQSQAANEGREAAREEGRAALAAAIGTGEGVGNRINPAAAGSATMGGQAASVGPAIDASRLGSAQASLQALGLGAGTAGNIANVQNMGFTNQMDLYRQKQAEAGPMDLVGAGLGLATKFIPGNWFAEEGGAIPEPTQMFQAGGGPVPPELSPSGGVIPDDINATINGTDGTQQDAQINAGEFIFPADAARWIGEKQLQKMVAKAQQEMVDPNQAPAQPEMAEAGAAPPTMDGAGIPPLPAGVV